MNAPLETIAFDFEPEGFVAACTDTSGVPVELLEVSGLRGGDADTVLTALKASLARRFDIEPRRRRIVVWTHAGRLALDAESAQEYAEVRGWLDRGVLAFQHPWKLPMVGQAGVAVLQGELPAQLRELVVDGGIVLDHDEERAAERRRKPRTEY